MVTSCQLVIIICRQMITTSLGRITTIGPGIIIKEAIGKREMMMRLIGRRLRYWMPIRKREKSETRQRGG